MDTLERSDNEHNNLALADFKMEVAKCIKPILLEEVVSVELWTICKTRQEGVQQPILTDARDSNRWIWSLWCFEK